ncbi:MAG: efflux RND transporter periplasmic adaptor subunit [Candidatus Schekmanbacteria bacterium]|nr:efflux RND transporter periplasmic adaptor subunit [Candidatus Schekmanbacteria bacterium]
MNRPTRLAVKIAAGLALAGAAVLVARALLAPSVVLVAIQQVARGRVERTVANTRAGAVTACHRSRLAPNGGGQVAKLPVREGDHVEAGQVLLELWNEDLAAQLTLAMREAEAADANAQQACLMAGLARRDASRLNQLNRSGILAESSADQATSNADAGSAACTGAKATAAVAKARVEVVRTGLERTVLRAPFAGTVAKLFPELGEYVTPSPPGIPTEPAIDLVQLDCIYVTAPLDEVDAPALRPGQDVRITLDALPGRSFPGRLRRIASYVDDRERQARTVDAEAEFTDPQSIQGLLPGYTADIEVILQATDDAVRVPTDAVREGSRVLVYGEGLPLEDRRFTPGLSNWRFTEVLDGLEAGERIVVSLDREGVIPGALAHAEPPSPQP